MNTTTNTTPITTQIISLKSNWDTAADKESFLKFHATAVKKSDGDLKPITDNDVEQADYIVISTNDAGKKIGQCLLFNVQSGADRAAPYLPHLPEEQEDQLILTSLSGKKAIPNILEEIQSTSLLSGFAFCAKTKASNSFAKETFETSGFSSEGPMKIDGDDYQSYLYHGKSNVESTPAVKSSPLAALPTDLVLPAVNTPAPPLAPVV